MKQTTTMAAPAPSRQSALAAFASCPYRYFGEYEQREGDIGNAFTRRGSGFHLAALVYVRAIYNRGETHNPDIAGAALKEALLSVPIDVHDEVTDLFWRWAETFRLNVDAFLLAEERQSEEFTWQPDLVYVHENVLEIVDFKTYYKALTETQAAAEFQSQFYCWRAAELWPGFARYRFTYDFVRLNMVVSVDFSPGQLRQFAEDRVRPVQRGIENSRASGEWEATPSDECTFCVLRCPLVHRIVEVDVVPVKAEADAALVLRELAALEQAVKHRKTVLQHYCATKGPIAAAGLIAGYGEPGQSKTFPLADVADVLREAGLLGGVTLTNTTLKPYLTQKRYAYLRPKLDPLAVVKPVAPRFGIKKHADDGADPNAADD